MDKLADGLQKLNEDDLLQVVQMVHDNKSADSYTVNDVERSSFSLFVFGMLELLTKYTNLYRGRIPRRSVHPSRYTHQDAVGFRSTERHCIRSVSTSFLFSLSYLMEHAK